MFIPHRKHTYGPPRPVAGMAGYIGLGDVSGLVCLEAYYGDLLFYVCAQYWPLRTKTAESVCTFNVHCVLYRLPNVGRPGKRPLSHNPCSTWRQFLELIAGETVKGM
jgi:hypothetical protein